MTRRAASLLLALTLAGCATGPSRVATTAPKPLPTLAPPKSQTPDWRDEPEAPGGWSYARDANGSAARFGGTGDAAFEVRCELAARTIALSRPGTAASAMTFTTSYGARSWPAGVASGRVTVRLAAADPFLDQLAFSRGRFEVTGPGFVPLILPAWAEFARVIEDCRG